MKSQIVNLTMKSLSAAAVTIALVVGNPMSSLAKPLPVNKTIHTLEDKVSLKYIGSNSKSVIFHLQYENPSANAFTLLIKNEAGDIVYEGLFKDVHFSKDIYLAVDEMEINPTFVIRAEKQVIEHSFSINRKFIEKTEVTKI
jgi:hypothetical protein